jgi:hypothetical protein
MKFAAAAPFLPSAEPSLHTMQNVTGVGLAG